MNCFFAESAAKIGLWEEAQNRLSEAETLVTHSQEHWCEAELFRIKGELLLRQQASNATIAENYFHQSLAIARRQGAKSWELRTVICLAKLWRAQGKSYEARALLAPIYDWFTEGFDTVDLKDAKDLLVELSH